jgi:hypothetical protein
MPSPARLYVLQRGLLVRSSLDRAWDAFEQVPQEQNTLRRGVHVRSQQREQRFDIEMTDTNLVGSSIVERRSAIPEKGVDLGLQGTEHEQSTGYQVIR